MRIVDALPRLRPRRVASAVAVLVLAGGIAVATGAIPDSSTGEVALCVKASRAVGERGGAPLSILDDQANLKGCNAGDRKLLINQRGPTGAAGAAGAAGPAGEKGDAGAAGPAGEKGDAGTNGTDATTTAYAARESSAVLPLYVTKTLPAGSYVINAKAVLANFAGFEQEVKCDLRPVGRSGDAVFQTLAGTSSQSACSESVALQLTLSDFAGGDIEFGCGDDGNEPSLDGVVGLGLRVTAIKVGSIQ